MAPAPLGADTLTWPLDGAGVTKWVGAPGLWQALKTPTAVKRWWTKHGRGGALPACAPAYRGGLLVFGGPAPAVLLGFERPGFGCNVADFLGPWAWSPDTAVHVVHSMGAHGIGAVISLDRHGLGEIRYLASSAGLRVPVSAARDAFLVEDFTTARASTLVLCVGQVRAWARHGVPTAVHCAGGTGRTGLILTAMLMASQAWRRLPVTVEEALTIVQAKCHPRAGEVAVGDTGSPQFQLLEDFARFLAAPMAEALFARAETALTDPSGASLDEFLVLRLTPAPW